MTEIIFKMPCRNKAHIVRTVKNALESFKIKEKVKSLILERNNKLGNDVNVDYSNLKSGKVIISFGRKIRITRRLMFHELGHVWDAIKNGLDFSKEKFSKKQQIIGGVIVNLSLDGRLEKNGLPHISKTERYKFFTHANKKFNLGFAKNDFAKLWGAKLKKKEVKSYLKNIKLLQKALH